MDMKTAASRLEIEPLTNEVRLRVALEEISKQPYWTGNPTTYASGFQSRYNHIVNIADEALRDQTEEKQQAGYVSCPPGSPGFDGAEEYRLYLDSQGARK